MFDRLDAPNVIGVLLDRPVAGEVAGLGDVDDARMTPFRMVAVAFGDFLLGLAVGLEVLEDEVFVVPVEEGRVEHTEVVPADRAVDEGIHEAADGGVIAVHLPRRVAAVDVVVHDFVSPQPEDDTVFVADLAVDFDVGPVHGPQGDGTVHHELHVARARRFLAGCRNLFAHVSSREEELA